MHRRSCENQGRTSFWTGRDVSTGDWDEGYPKGECYSDGAVTAVGQMGYANTVATAMVCSHVASGAAACTTQVFSDSNARETLVRGDWAVGYFKGECGEGRHIKGISTDPGYGDVHALLCCR